MSESFPFIHIKSSKFPILPGESEEILNEGMYGKALCKYLQDRLQDLGYKVPFICSEDWGWWVEISGQPFKTGVCVYATESLSETNELCAVAVPDPDKKWSWSLFRFVDTSEVAVKLQSDLTEIFDHDPEIEVLGFPEAYPLD